MPIDPETGRAHWTPEEVEALRKGFDLFKKETKPALQIKKNVECLQDFDVNQITEKLRYSGLMPSRRSSLKGEGESSDADEAETEDLKEAKRLLKKRTSNSPHPKPAKKTWARLGSPIARVEDKFIGAILVSPESRLPWLDAYPSDEDVKIQILLPPTATVKFTKIKETETIFITINYAATPTKGSNVTKADIQRVEPPSEFHFKFEFAGLDIDYDADVDTISGENFVCFSFSRIIDEK